MNNRLVRAPAIVGAVAGMALVAAACSAGTPTPIYIQLTPTPAPPTPIIIYVTPAPTPTPAPTAALTATPASSPTAVSSTAASPSAGGPGAASGCSGKATNQPWWVEAANMMPFTVYCGVVSKPWSFSSASSTYPPMGTVTATYENLSGAKIVIQEGAFCTAGGSACSPHDTVVGPAKFGDLDGTLDTLGPGLGYAIYVNAGTAAGYTATGTNVTQAAFVSIVAALIKVPKS
ncbi:MAG: hypothetical protein ABSG37_03460 [Candidatus Limnocylindrales bacterium]